MSGDVMSGDVMSGDETSHKRYTDTEHLFLGPSGPFHAKGS